MAVRAFPVIFARRVSVTAEFYESFGFERHVQLPVEGEPGYVGLRRDTYELAVVAAEWPLPDRPRRLAFETWRERGSWSWLPSLDLGSFVIVSQQNSVQPTCRCL